ncbi:hypothetical protein [Rhodococcus sp. Q]|uniref:hypothetical protein n=1 Tax=Rhodococcus sp. Q TaxID=2502252 RepID=UPI0010F56A8C|nr:hypothetical protein [Rhodococcus sp. Q]
MILTIHVLVCGDAALPESLSTLPCTSVPAVPAKPDFDALLPALDDTDARLVVVGDDGALAATVTRLMRGERLHVEVAYVAAERTPVTRLYGLPVGERAAHLAVTGAVSPLPLIRDDSGTALVGEATITGPDGGPLVGEAYADSERVFSGEIPALRVAPTPALPGVRASAGRRLLRTHWLPARAVQLGAVGAVVTRDGVTTPRALKRCSFYRDDRSWLLVR